MAYTRSAIVTGGTLNLGYYAALEIAREHPDWLVVVCSRSDQEKAADSINQALGQDNAIFLPLDLSKSQIVRDFAKDWSSKNRPPIQALLLNAALQFPQRMMLTEEGLESTFAISHVGHALLFHLLFPHLSSDARVIVTASGVHDPAQKSGLPDANYVSAEALAHPPPEVAKKPGTQHYTNAKLANIMWTYAVHRRLCARAPDAATTTSITINAFDPGLMPGSGLARAYPPLFRFVWNRVMPCMTPVLQAVFTPNIHKPSESGASLARLAASPETAGLDGKYLEGPKEIQSSPPSYDEEKQNDLWHWTIQYCAQNEAQTARFENFSRDMA